MEAMCSSPKQRNEAAGRSAALKLSEPSGLGTSDRLLLAHLDPRSAGGLLVAVQPASRTTTLSPVAERVVASPRWASFFSDFQPQRFYLTREECLELLVQVGFEPVIFEETYAREHYPTMEAFLDWL
jgi:hypothetical protein